MPIIKLETVINAKIEICFNLSRSIDLHVISTSQTGEKAIAGKTSGLIELGEQVTWKAKHFGVWQTLTSKITAFNYPNLFVDEMVNGAFKSFKHQHIFREENNQTIMVDIFDYTSPFLFAGKIADVLFLKKYMTNLLEERNHIIKTFAESEQWKKVLK